MQIIPLGGSCQDSVSCMHFGSKHESKTVIIISRFIHPPPTRLHILSNEGGHYLWLRFPKLALHATVGSCDDAQQTTTRKIVGWPLMPQTFFPKVT